MNTITIGSQKAMQTQKVFVLFLLCVICICLSSCKKRADSNTKLSHFEGNGIAFDYPSTLTIPPKDLFDIDKVREMQKPYGVELLTLMSSEPQRTILYLSRSKKEGSFESLYEEKKTLAAQVNSAGVDFMGDRFTKFSVEKTQLSGNVQALSEYGEKANGEVAVIYEFLKDGDGYAYGLLFIYDNRDYAESGAKIREKIVSSLRITAEK
jgi:hypothetical protein